AAMAFSLYRRPVPERRNIMWFSSWLRSRTWSGAPRRRTRNRPAAPRFRPRLEALEDRTVPSQVSLTVSSLADSGPGTLRDAILTADAGSHSDKFTIGFSVTGTIDLQSPLPDLNNTIAIQGPGASSLTVEPAAGALFASAVVTVDPGQTASLSGLTIANGNARGIANKGTLTITGSTIAGNSAPFPAPFGGGIFNGGTLTVRGRNHSGNSAAYYGGGIFNGGTLTVSGCTISGNTAGYDGGGIWNLEGTANISGCTLSGNSAFEGGSIANFGGAMTVGDSTISGNSALFGGGIYNNPLATLTIKGGTLSGNSANSI